MYSIFVGDMFIGPQNKVGKNQVIKDKTRDNKQKSAVLRQCIRCLKRNVKYLK